MQPHDQVKIPHNRKYYFCAGAFSARDVAKSFRQRGFNSFRHENSILLRHCVPHRFPYFLWIWCRGGYQKGMKMRWLSSPRVFQSHPNLVVFKRVVFETVGSIWLSLDGSVWKDVRPLLVTLIKFPFIVDALSHYPKSRLGEGGANSSRIVFCQWAAWDMKVCSLSTIDLGITRLCE